MENLTNISLLNLAKKAYVDGNPLLSIEILNELLDKPRETEYHPTIGDAYISLHIAKSALGLTSQTQSTQTQSTQTQSTQTQSTQTQPDPTTKKLEEIVTQDLELYFLDPEQRKHAQITYGLHLLRTHQYKKAYPYQKYAQPVTNFALGVTPETMSPPHLLRNLSKKSQSETLLIYSAGGLGDIIQYARFLPRICQHLKQHRIVFLVNERLFWIFDQLYQSNTNNKKNTNKKVLPNLLVCSFSRPQEIPKFDHHTNIHTLPAILDLEYTDIYTQSYLDPIIQNPNLEHPLHPDIQKIIHPNKLNVLINWHGKYNNAAEEFYRGIPLNTLKPLLLDQYLNQHINWISLQKEITPDDQIILNQELPHVHDLHQIIDQHPTDAFRDTLQLLTHPKINLLISTDTIYPHLAGTLQNPECWVLLTTAHDWRWSTYPDNSYTYWYTHLRLYKQETLGDWQLVLQRIKEKLKTKISKQQNESSQINLETLTEINI